MASAPRAILDDLRSRISQLNRAAFAAARVQSRLERTSELTSLIAGDTVRLESGSFYRIRRSVSQFCAAWPQSACWSQGRDHAGFPAHPELDLFVRSFPDHTLFLDLETCGFSGAPLFLIGLLRQVEGALVVEQLLARDYGEEPAVLQRLWELLPDYRVLITFNGKSFDWPFVEDRSVVHRLGAWARVRVLSRVSRLRLDPWAAQSETLRHQHSVVHCDLLPLARRYWKRQLGLPNCKLQTLEAMLCRRYRSGDIPGYLIPHAYHGFVRSGDARQLQQILEHNACDLVTLAQLTLLMVRQQDAPEHDLYSPA